MSVLPVTALAAAAALASPHAQAGVRQHAAAAGHLYVVAYVGQQQEILRYPFVGAFPATQPDLVYQGVADPIAVGHDGTLYATVPLSCCYGLGQIDVFPPNSNVYTRQITLPNLHEDTTIDTAMVEGAQAYLYVGYAAFISGISTGRPAPKQGVAIYPPGANGGGRPLRMFDVPRDLAGPTALGFNADGSLYTATQSSDDVHNRIWTLSDPLGGRDITSVLKLASSDYAEGIAFADRGRMEYVLNLGPPAYSVEVFASTAHGHAPPIRTITLPTNTPANGIGLEGRHVFVGVYSPPEVIAYDRDASGAPQPVFTLPIAGAITVEAMAVGP
jgi:hypothetical protein